MITHLIKEVLTTSLCLSLRVTRAYLRVKCCLVFLHMKRLSNPSSNAWPSKACAYLQVSPSRISACQPLSRLLVLCITRLDHQSSLSWTSTPYTSVHAPSDPFKCSAASVLAHRCSVCASAVLYLHALLHQKRLRVLICTSAGKYKTAQELCCTSSLSPFPMDGRKNHISRHSPTEFTFFLLCARKRNQFLLVKFVKFHVQNAIRRSRHLTENCRMQFVVISKSKSPVVYPRMKLMRDACRSLLMHSELLHIAWA